MFQVAFDDLHYITNRLATLAAAVRQSGKFGSTTASRLHPTTKKFIAARSVRFLQVG